MIRYGMCYGVGSDITTESLASSGYTVKSKNTDGTVVLNLTLSNTDEIWGPVPSKVRPRFLHRIRIGRSYFHFLNRTDDV